MQDISGESTENTYINEQNNFSEPLETIPVDNLDNTVSMENIDNQNNFAEQLGSVSEDSFNINNATQIESNFDGSEFESTGT
jgi:hypothetical protein